MRNAAAAEKYEPVPVTPSILRPPGGLAVWIFVCIELLTFGGAMLVFLMHRSAQPEIYAEAQAHLSRTLGALNTFVLITSGFFVAQAVSAYKGDHLKKSSNLLLTAGVLGCVFLGIKTYEYIEKWTAGHMLGDGDFFSYYWGFTGFHYLHVVIGVFFLFAMSFKLKRNERFTEEDLDIDSGAVYWHMCDLIWILLFPLLYILN